MDKDRQMLVRHQMVEEMLMQKFYEHHKQIVNHFRNYSLIQDPTIWKSIK
jgi:hypothetical protein